MSLRTALVVLLLAAPMVASGARAEDKAADGAAIVRGTGRTRRDGSRDWTDTRSGAVILAGITVEASKDEPMELTLPDGVEILLEPGANASWKVPGRLPTEHNGWARGYHLQLNEGEIHVRVPSEPRGKRAFLVSTRAGTLTDWRGSVSVSAHEDTTVAAIYEGALVVGSNGQGFPVYDGAGILMKKGSNPDRGRAIPAAPAFSRGAREGATPTLSIVRDEQRAPLTFAWDRVAGAARYRVELASDPKMWRVVHRAEIPDAGGPTSSIEVPGTLGGARYYARVRAIGPEGIVGGWSDVASQRAVRIALPDKAFVAKDGVIVLPPGTGVTLPEPEGLEAAYEVLRTPGPRVPLPLHFAAAPPKLHVGDELLRIVHLRESGSGARGELSLAPRSLRAAVELTPKRARWPEDPIDLRVALWDPSGRLDPAREHVALETSVNLEALALAWERNGSTFRARLAPRGSQGPWVLRVTVRDSFGAEVGGGFLEIDGHAAAARRDRHEVRIYR